MQFAVQDALEGSVEPTWAIADDLSGACEIAAVAHSAGLDAEVTLALDERLGFRILDLAIRQLEPTQAYATCRQVFQGIDLRYFKVDSLLRGPIGAVARACMEHRPGVLFCPALPVHGRSIVAGTPLVHGVPLANCGLWGAEPTPPPDVVPDVLAPDRTSLVELAIVRGDEAALDAAADAAIAREAVICADAVTDDDLDRLAGLVERRGLTAIGSAGLFAALVRRQPSLAGPGAANVDHASPTTPGVLVVAGSAATAVRNQLAELDAATPDVIELGACGPTGESLLRRVSARLRLGATAVLTWASGPPAAQARTAETAATMAAVAARLVVDVPSTRLVLTGGQTARSVLDALGIASLRPLQTPHYGALVARCSDGRIVAIRPGSFGDRHSLADLVAAVRGEIDLRR